MRNPLALSRFGVIVAGVALAAWPILDPYTYYSGAGDAVTGAPWWHVALAAVDLGLTVAFAVFGWRNRVWAAAGALLVGGLWSIGETVLYVRLDGLLRFAAGYGGSEFLSLYLGTLALRLVLILALVQPLRDMTPTVRKETSSLGTD